MLHEIFFGKYYLRLKKDDKKFNFRFAAMPKMISQILVLNNVDFTKTKKSKYLESKTSIFL